MASPTLDVRLTFAGPTTLNFISNDGFETNTTGWSVAAGIQGAATSITRTVSGPYMGVAVGRLVTTSTSGSGVKFVMGGTFVANHTYRFRVYLKSISGTTSAGIRIGSLGTPGDRATNTFTITTSFAAYQVDFTPANNRSDVQVNVYTNTAAIMTADIDDAEVFDTIDDIGLDVDSLTWTHGANFEGGLSAGSATLTMHNELNQFSDGSRRIYPGMALFVRATYLGVPYGLWYGIVKRATAEGNGRTLTVYATDIVDSWARSAQVSFGYAAVTAAFHRATILIAMGTASTQRNLSTSEAEADIPMIGYDSSDPLSVLHDLDQATGTLSFLRFDPSTSVLYVYTTLARNQRSARASSETVSTSITSLSSDINEDVNISDQVVNFTTRNQSSVDNAPWIWSYGDLTEEDYLSGAGNIHLHLDAGQTISGVESIPPAFNCAFGYGYTGSAPTATATFTASSLIWSLTGAAGGNDFTYVRAHGTTLEVASDTVSQVGTTTLGWHVLGSDISTNYLPSGAAAQGLASWITEHTTGLVPRYDVTVENLFPTEAVRQVGDLITLTPTQVSAASVDVIIRSLTTTVSQTGLDWQTQWLLDVAGNPTASGAFIIGSSSIGGSDTLGY